MKISIITATYNSGKTLGDTLESILNQTYKDFEVIIKDGGSKDNTLDVVREYEQKFAGRLRWVSHHDEGIYDAMNQGIAMAQGDVIGILNSDDFYSDNTVLESIAESIETLGVDCVYGNLVFVDHDDPSRIIRTWNGSQYIEGGFSKGWHPAHPTFYARKELFDKYGAFDVSFDVSADFELMLRFIEKHNATNYYLDREFVRMRVGGESTGSLSKIILGNKNVLRAFEKNELKVPPFYLIRRLAPKVFDVVKTRIGI